MRSGCTVDRRPLRAILWLVTIAVSMSACSLNAMDKTACVTSGDCLTGWACLNRTCVRFDGSASGNGKDAATIGDSSGEQVDSGRPATGKGVAPPVDGPRERFVRLTSHREGRGIPC